MNLKKLFLINKGNENSRLKLVSLNFLYLFFTQATNYLLPLITFPYLVKVIGIEKFGTVSFALSLVLYVSAVTDYGFSMSATKRAALLENRIRDLSSLFNNVFYAKCVIFVLSVIAIIPIILLFNKFSRDSLFYFLCIPYVIGSVFNPTWFFQGIEKMKYITIFSTFNKLLATALIFCFIKASNDYAYVLLIYGIANIVSSVFGIILAFKFFKIEVLKPDFSCIKYELKYSWYYFVNNIALLTLNNINILILGLFVNDFDLGKYSIAEKIAFSVWQMLVVFSQAIYPQICKLSLVHYKVLFNFLLKVCLPFGSFVLCICLCFCIFSEDIVRFITSDDIENVAFLLKLLSFHGLIIFLNIPAYQTLLAYNFQKETSVLFNILSVICLVSSLFLSSSLGITGAAISAILTQLMITISLYVLLVYKLKGIFNTFDNIIATDYEPLL